MEEQVHYISSFKTFYKLVQTYNDSFRGQFNGPMAETHGRYWPKSQEPDESDLIYAKDKLELQKVLQKLGKPTANTGKTDTYKGIKKIVLERSVCLMATQATDGMRRYILKDDTSRYFKYRRYYDPETTAYVDYNPDYSHIDYIGYLDYSKQIKGRAKALLELAIAYENASTYTLHAVLPTPDKTVNKMCAYYESIGFKFLQYDDIRMESTKYSAIIDPVEASSAAYELNL